MEKQIYYVPVYCYRHFPSIESFYEEIINHVFSEDKIKIYSTFEKACSAGQDMLCDDDTYGVFEMAINPWGEVSVKYIRDKNCVYRLNKISNEKFKQLFEICH